MKCPQCHADLEVDFLGSGELVEFNPGKGLVFEAASTVARMGLMYRERGSWTNVELNRYAGWQFSQAIYAIRRKLEKKESNQVLRSRLLNGKLWAYPLEQASRRENLGRVARGDGKEKDDRRKAWCRRPCEPPEISLF